MASPSAEGAPAKVENSDSNPPPNNQESGGDQGGPPRFQPPIKRGGGGRFNNNRRGGGFNRGDGGNFQRGSRRQGGGGGRDQNPHLNQSGGGDDGGGGGGGGGGEGREGRRGGGHPMMRNQGDKLNEKLHSISGPTYDIPPLETAEKKFSGRGRLYIGNIGNEVTEEELGNLFTPFGETSELFVNKEKNFAFIRVDYRVNAEKAKRELDGTNFKGRSLKIRFAPNGSAVKVKNLTHFVSNELLYYAFQIFGEIERALVHVDERGKPTGEGTVEFARKGCALHAVRKCSEGCFFLTGSLRPCIVEIYDAVDDTDGYPEKFLPRKNPEYMKQREVGPRFANSSSFEYEYGMRWKQMHELFAQKEQAMRKEFEMEKEKLEAQMEFARYEHETEMLRDQLRAREMDRDRQKHEWEMKERLAEEQRARNEEQMRRQQEEMQQRIVHQDEEMRRRQQENNLFMQAHQLDNMLDQQEQAYQQPSDMYNMTPEANANNANVVIPKNRLFRKG